MANHKRKKTCVICQNKYEYIWQDSEAWVEKILCSICRNKQSLKDKKE